MAICKQFEELMAKYNDSPFRFYTEGKKLALSDKTKANDKVMLEMALTSVEEWFEESYNMQQLREYVKKNPEVSLDQLIFLLNSGFFNKTDQEHHTPSVAEIIADAL